VGAPSKSTSGTTTWDPRPPVLDAVGLVRPAGAEFDADGDGIEEAVFYNGYRSDVDLVGPKARRRWLTAAGTSASRAISAWSTWPSTACRAGGPHRPGPPLGHEWRGVDRKRSTRSWRRTSVVVEPGDMVLFHTGFATKVREWNRDPDPKKIHAMCTYLDARDPAVLEWITESQLSALVADNYAVEGDGRRGIATRAGTRCCRSTTSASSSSASPSESSGTCTAGDLAARAQPEPVTAHGPPLRLPGIVGSPATPIATV